MIDMRKMLHVARLAAVLAAALAISACASKTGDDAQANAAGQATPGSQQDFVVNVGDRVFFETDSSELTPQSRAALDKQAQWLTTYSQYGQFTVEGHADERGTREYNIALGARRAQANQATSNWTEVPVNWDQLRWQWEVSHAVNAGITFLGFCSLTISLLVTRE